MPTIDCATAQNRGVGEAAGAQGPGRFHGTPQQKADQLVRAIVLGDLGQKGSSVQALAATLRKVLAQSDVAGTDTPDDVLKKIEVSLQKAAQALADRGYDAKTIDATIDKFRSQLADALDSNSGTPDTTTPGTPPATTPASSSPPVAQNDTRRIDKVVAREVRKQRGAIEILTAEGDQVSIHFRTQDVTTGSVKQTTAADGTTTTAARGSVISRGRLQVEVDGNLNDDELAAIGHLLGKVDALATKFFSGDVQAAFAAAADLGVDSDQIASYQLDLTYSRKMAVAAWSSAASLPAPAESSTSSSGPAPAAAVTTAPAASSATRASTSTAASPIADAPAATDAPATPAPATAQKTIADYIGDVLSKLGSIEGAGRISFSMRFKMNVLVTALETLKPSAAATRASGTVAAADNTQLLGDSLQSAVA